MKRQGKAKDRRVLSASRFGTASLKALTVAKPLAPIPRFVRRGRRMFDRLSSLVIALTLVVIAAIFAALTGGDPLSIALMAVAGFVAAGTVYSALPASLPDAQGAAPSAEAPPVSLLRHPDFARWVDQEKDPLLGVADNIVAIANDAAIRLLGRHIVGADIRTAIRHPAAAEWLSRINSDAPLETINLVDVPRPGQRWTMRIATLSDGQRIVMLSDHSAIDAADRAATRLIDAVETFGQAGQMIGCDAVALVADRQPHAVSLSRQFDRDGGPRLPIFHRVGNDVVRKLPELRAVAQHRLRRVAQY